jgi:stage II sporulation protein D
MKQSSFLWTIRRPFANAGAIFRRRLRALVEGFRTSRESRAMIMLAAAMLSLSGGSPTRRPLAHPTNANESEIDAALQQAATAALGNREGTIIVMDARTGRVRGIVNPERAYEQALMPGSAIKPFTALAALRAGLIDEDSRTVCPGRFAGLSFSLPCVHADHLPPFSPSQAIAYSCNYYFATMGQRLGRENLIAVLREFDFGEPTGIGTNEAGGMLRPCDLGSNARVRRAEANHASETADCSARQAVGESDRIQVTPIQLLTAYTALVNGGHLYQPQIAPAADFHEIERARLNIAEGHREIISKGMAGAVRYGTARNAKLDSLPLTILGKTGTAMPAKGFRNNGWFVGFAGPFKGSGESDLSKLDLAVLVLLSRAHGSEAAMVARPIFEIYANKSQKPEEKLPSSQNAEADSKGRNSQSPIRVHLVRNNVTQELSLEDYVLGVLRAEGTMENEPEALRALAIAVRTYALKNVGRHAKSGYDFCSTTHCQRFVLAGSGGTNPAVSEGPVVDAVRATTGQVLLDDHAQVVDSYFGASCGGETANIGELWGITPPLYLRGVRDEFCDEGPHAKWIDTISHADLLRALQSDSRTDVGSRLDQVTVSKRDETGRAELITIEGEHRKTVRGWDFKIIVGRVLGWNVLKSSRFEIARAGSSFVFRGSGFGHGLGLCQEGAHVMAARGASYQKILEKYFPGTRIGNRNRLITKLANSTTEDTEELAETTERDPMVPLRKLPRPLRLTTLSHHAPAPKTTTISSEHFRVTYSDDVDRRDANEVLNTLEAARNDYLRRASAASVAVNIPTLAIRLNESTGDFTARTGQPWWAAAATKGNRIEMQPLGLLKRRGVLFTTLRHELAHTVIDSISNNRAPRWLAEGFAIYLAGEGQTISRYAMRGSLSRDELEKRLEHPRTQQEMRGLYAQAYLNIVEMIRTQGEASVWKSVSGK